MLVGCPIPAGLKLAAVEDYEPLSPVDRMLAAGGVALLSAAHAAMAYPEIYRKEKAARYAPGGPHFFDGRRLSCLYHPPSGF